MIETTFNSLLGFDMIFYPPYNKEIYIRRRASIGLSWAALRAG